MEIEWQNEGMANWSSIAVNILNLASQFPLEKLVHRNADKDLDDFQQKVRERNAERLTQPNLTQNAPKPTMGDSIQGAENPQENGSKDAIATACVPCALGHFSQSAGALNEAMRFKKDGIGSNEVLDRIASVLEEQNALERFDLTPEKLQKTPGWEKQIAEEALQQSRQLRHRLEGIQSIEELEQAAADTARFYKKINRAWYKGRFRNLGQVKSEAIAKRIGPEN